MVFIAAIYFFTTNVQAVCFPNQCDRLDMPTGDLFCRSGDVYSRYIDYFCSSNECISETVSRKIEECSLSCSQGTCVKCERTVCNSKDGYYGNTFCKNDNVYRKYRNYECDSSEGCTFTVSDRLNETCDFGCSSGKCKNTCDQKECDKKDGFYEDQFCKFSDNNLYREYRDYYCEDKVCKINITHVNIATCTLGCKNDACITSCTTLCNQKDGFYGESFCKDGDVYQNYRDYRCRNDRCEYTESSKKIRTCINSCNNGSCTENQATTCINHCEGDVYYYDADTGSETCNFKQINCNELDSYSDSFCKNGDSYRTFNDYRCTSKGCSPVAYDSLYQECLSCGNGICIENITQPPLAPPSLTTLEINYTFTFDSQDEVLFLEDAEIFNGILFGNKDFRKELNADIKKIEFDITKTNGLGEMVIKADGESFLSTTEAGHHSVEINRHVNEVSFSSKSSGIFLFSPSSYGISNVKIYLAQKEIFELDEKLLENFQYARIYAPQKSKLLINGKEVSGFIIKNIFQRINTVLLFSDDKEVKLRIFYLG